MRPVLVVGQGDLAAELVRAVRDRGTDCVHLRRPTDRELARALRSAPTSVAVISHDDILALRLALVVEHSCPGVQLLVTVFDATVAAQLRRAVPNCQVVSLADAVAPTLVHDCMGATAAPTRWRTRRSSLMAQVRPHDAASRMLVLGVSGLLITALAEVTLAVLAFEEPMSRAFYEAAKTTATVGPDRVAEHGPGWYAVAVGGTMLMGLALNALATAGLVHRLTTRRLTALVGCRTIPRGDHVIVVGLGQVGLRLALLLRQIGVGVVAVERDQDVPNVHLAKRLGIPVVVGDGTERKLLARLRLRRARALASVTSDDHVNIAVSVAALAVTEDVRVVLRAGDDDAVTETRALFPIGVVRDVNRLAAERFAESLRSVPTPDERGSGDRGP